MTSGEKTVRRRAGTVGLTLRVLAGGLLALAVLASSVTAAPAPRIACDRPVHHFGKRESNVDEVAHTFVLKNTGDITLEIRDIEIHCGCTDLKLSHRMIAPGGEAALSMKLSLRGRSGEVEKYLILHTNDPTQPRFRVGFEGQIEPEVDVVPMAALFGTIPERVAVTQTVDVVFAAQKPDRVLAAASDRPEFGASVQEVEAQHRYRVRIFTAPPLPPGAGYLRASVRVKTAKPRSPGIVIPVSAMLLADLIVGPSELVLFTTETGPLTRYAVVRPGRVQEFKITEVEVPHPDIRWRTRPAPGGGIQVELTNIPVTSDLNGRELVLRTSLGTNGVFRIPVRVLRGRN